MNSRIDGQEEGWKEGRNEGLPAKHSITCWVHNWWGGYTEAFACFKSTVFALLYALVISFSRGFVGSSHVGPDAWTPNITDVTDTPLNVPLHTLEKCQPPGIC